MGLLAGSLALALSGESLPGVASAEQATPTAHTSASTAEHPTIVYSTYYGSTDDGERHSTSGDALAIDAAGHTYISGMTSAGDLPLKNPYDASPSGSLWAGYIAKLDPTGSSLSYASYFGGGFETIVKGIAVDAQGNIYLTGSAREGFVSHNSPIQQDVRGDADAFVAKLSADGQTLIYAALLGGTDYDIGYHIAVDAQGYAYIAGETRSSDFPTVAPLQPRFSGPGKGNGDAFVTKITPDGSKLVYSTFLGGSDADGGSGIAADKVGAAYVTGFTNSSDFPVVNALQPRQAGGGDAFVAKIAADGASLTYSTYVGGKSQESGAAVAIDGAGSAYVIGTTASSDLPVSQALQPVFNGGVQKARDPDNISDAFVAQLAPDGSKLAFASYLGGSGAERGLGIGLDAKGDIYLGGQTTSFDFPVVRPIQANYSGDNNGLVTDSFLTKLAPDGEGVLYSTYFGSVSWDNLQDLAVDPTGNLYITGDVDAPSPDFPLAGTPFQTTNKGIRSAFIAEIADNFSGPPQPFPTATPHSQNTGPSHPPAGYDKRWLQGIPCTPPCWEGITPGTTTMTDAVRLLQQNLGIQPSTVLSRPSGQPEEHAGYIQWKWLGSDEGGQMVYEGATGPPTITDIWPDLDGIPGADASVTLGQVIAAYGEPSHIHAKGFFGRHGDGPFYTATFYWESHGIVLEPNGSYYSKPHLGPDLRLEHLTFSIDPVRPQRPTFAGMPDDPNTGPQPWHGYQSFDVYCRNTSISGKPGSPCPDERLFSIPGQGLFFGVCAVAVLLFSVLIVRTRIRTRPRNIPPDK